MTLTPKKVNDADHLSAPKSAKFIADFHKKYVVDKEYKKPKEISNLDLFLVEFNFSKFKGDMGCLELPLFTLQKTKDTNDWEWESEDGKSRVSVIPNKFGRATLFDQDILIYCVSGLVHALNEGIHISRTVVFNTADYFKALDNSVGGQDYLNFELSLDRLKGSTIKTNVKQGGCEETKSFGLIESYRILKSGSNKSVLRVEITLSNWIFSALLANRLHVKTINPNYFKLRKSTERRLYQIALKKVGTNSKWEIGIDALKRRMGSAQKSRPHFIQSLRIISKNDQLPDFKLTVEGSKVKFTNRDPNVILRKAKNK